MGESHLRKGTWDKLVVPLEPGLRTRDLQRELDDQSPSDLIYP